MCSCWLWSPACHGGTAEDGQMTSMHMLLLRGHAAARHGLAWRHDAGRMHSLRMQAPAVKEVEASFSPLRGCRVLLELRQLLLEAPAPGLKS